jgi:probable rRNA maturation factor
MSPSVSIAVSVESGGWTETLRGARALARKAARAALDGAAVRKPRLPRAAELGIVLADDELVRRLNRAYRRKDKPTNVLSFAATTPAERKRAESRAGGPVLLGDVILAFETVRDEAEAQGKRFAHHLAHLVVHGTLHLLDYDHRRAAEAARMERLEAAILAGLGIADPYRSRTARAGRRAGRTALHG